MANPDENGKIPLRLLKKTHFHVPSISTQIDAVGFGLEKRVASLRISLGSQLDF